MRKISFAEVQALPNGTRVFVELVGRGWCSDDKECWNIKQEDGLHYEIEDEENVISFPYNFDYDANNMQIICYVDGYGCKCCLGDDAIFQKDDKNSVFIDDKGNMLATVKGITIRFKVHYCPICGRKFLEE